MQLKQLQYFVSLCETLSFTRTAKEFFVSQSAVTIQIGALEKELGTRLFQRTNRKVELTGAGTVLREEATAILSRLKARRRKVSQWLYRRIVRSSLTWIGRCFERTNQYRIIPGVCWQNGSTLARSCTRPPQDRKERSGNIAVSLGSGQ